MARSQTATTPAPAKPHRTTRGVAKAVEPKETVVAAEFSPAEHHDEIAVAAYLTWLVQGGSAEENWLTAQAEVRDRYS